MKRHWPSLFRDRPLVFKLIAINFLLIALPLAIASYVTYSSYSSSIQRNVGKYQADAVRELTTNIDTYMNELNLLSIMPYQSPEILQYLASSRHADEVLTYDERTMLEDFVKRVLVNGRVDVIGLYLYGNKGASYLVGPDNTAAFSDPSWKSEPWYDKASKTGKSIYIGSHNVRASNGTNYQVFSIVRKIISIDTGQDLGYLVLDVDINTIRNKMNQLLRATYEDVVIVDESGGLVYKRGDISLSDFNVSVHNGSGTILVNPGSSPKLLTYYTSPLTAWTTIETVPLSILLKETVEVRNYIMLIGIACLVLAVVASIWISVRITNPISQLRTLMKRVEKGDLQVSIPIRSRDEVGQLSQTFNLMVSRLSDLGYRLFESEIREKNSQIAALQSQINPHFLYNTLGSISMYAEIQGNKEVVRMTNNLSRLLRYSISSDNNEVALALELDHVRGYMTIQQIRYEERLQFSIHVAEELLAYSVIRLILQPIVENSIIHGFEKGRGSGKIVLTGIKDNGNMVITVEDDGKGMNPRELQKLHRKIENAPLPKGNSGHGLVNVHRRIALRYGSQYGLHIESSVHQGTQVTITLPIVSPNEFASGEEYDA